MSFPDHVLAGSAMTTPVVRDHAETILGEEKHLAHQEHEEFRRFCLAGISPNDMNIIGAFVEALTGCQNRFLSASHLHHDRALVAGVGNQRREFFDRGVVVGRNGR
jgi:hypothetical protein